MLVPVGAILVPVGFDPRSVESKHRGRRRQRPTCAPRPRERHMWQAARNGKQEDSPESAALNGWTWPKDQ